MIGHGGRLTNSIFCLLFAKFEVFRAYDSSHQSLQSPSMGQRGIWRRNMNVAGCRNQRSTTSYSQCLDTISIFKSEANKKPTTGHSVQMHRMANIQHSLWQSSTHKTNKQKMYTAFGNHQLTTDGNIKMQTLFLHSLIPNISTNNRKRLTLVGNL